LQTKIIGNSRARRGPNMMATTAKRRRGVSPVEVVIVVAIVGLVLMMAVMALPRGRENARLLSCNRNLMQIGQALQYYDGAVGHLPIVPPPGQEGAAPLDVVLGHFGLGDLEKLENPKTAPLKISPTSEHVIPGFLCPSDPNTRSREFRAPVSYRADAGPGTDGQGGPFSFGKATSIATVEAGVGADYTGAFSERLVGSGSGSPSLLNDYWAVPGPVGAEACPPGPLDALRGDAGSSWAKSGWASTLYNHAMRPNASPSCIASDEKTARMGASSGHARRVNVLTLGGSVRGFTPDVDAEIWKKFGTVERPSAAAGSTKTLESPR
jgi:type II secretory pathway pseudopilin PulG